MLWSASDVAIAPTAPPRNQSEGIFDVCFSMPRATGPSRCSGCNTPWTMTFFSSCRVTRARSVRKRDACDVELGWIAASVPRGRARYGHCWVRVGAAKEDHAHAREEDAGTRTTRPAGREVVVDAGGRVRPRGVPPHPRLQAPCALDEAGDRDRPVEGAPRGSRPSVPRTGRLGLDPAARGRRPRGGPAPAHAVAPSLPGDDRSVAPRGTCGRS